MSPNAAVLFYILGIIIALSCCSPRNFKSVKMHPKCASKTFCFERGNYPAQLIEDLVNKANLTQIDGDIPEHRQTSHSIVDPCETSRPANNTIPIYQVIDLHNNVRYVVQATRFKQIIHLAWCKNKGEITRNRAYVNVSQLEALNYKAYCCQSYTNYRFLVLSLDGTRLESVKARRIPVSCRCKMHPIGEVINPDYC
ncbi:uncharacterized protein LOC128671243 [Plodia interpunctella]|uniref:uncharacterized protein LOC128671243 n=1 Tax=Plodia interpunctella TaxID=58824 RepID=UPI0023675986|nr:uncharacterized protein LOC128671243 [Plodia interpunctella]